MFQMVNDNEDEHLQHWPNIRIDNFLQNQLMRIIRKQQLLFQKIYYSIEVSIVTLIKLIKKKKVRELKLYLKK